jgi:hypothetical protein
MLDASGGQDGPPVPVTVLSERVAGQEPPIILGRELAR